MKQVIEIVDDNDKEPEYGLSSSALVTLATDKSKSIVAILPVIVALLDAVAVKYANVAPTIATIKVAIPITP